MKDESKSVALRISAVTIILNFLLTVFKFIAGIVGKSGAMLSDAIHSASDVISTIIVMIGFVLSRKKSDFEHQYGHERLECVSALILAGILGATGAGKTTITNLINRFYDIADGKIRYDGININKIKKTDLRRSLGVVLQDVHLFTGTVMENIRYGKLDASDEECIAAAKLANAHDFIMMLPDGYDTVITGDG